MEGRTTEQKAILSKGIVKKLAEIFPQTPNIRDFQKATYCNKDMI